MFGQVVVHLVNYVFAGFKGVVVGAGGKVGYCSVGEHPVHVGGGGYCKALCIVNIGVYNHQVKTFSVAERCHAHAGAVGGN